MPFPVPKAVLAICLSCWLVGCARWNHVSQENSQLPAPKLAPDSVVLQIRVVSVPADASGLEEDLWQLVDEQHLPISVRRRWQDNGMRCGLLGANIPAALQQLIEQDEGKVKQDTETMLRRNHEGTWRQTLQARTGRRYRIVTTPTRPQIHVIAKEDGQVRGRTCSQAHCELAVRTFPSGDGSVQIELTPQVYYGEPKLDWEGKNQIGFIRVMKQNSVAFEHLRFHTTITAGQTLLLSCTPDVTGLGRQFFADPDGTTNATKLVLVSLAQSHAGDLFDSGPTMEPLETLTD